MVVNLRVKFEVANNRANDLIVGAVAAVENLKFPLKDGEQLFNIAMLLDKRSMIMVALHTVDQKMLSVTRYQLLRQIKSGSK